MQVFFEASFSFDEHRQCPPQLPHAWYSTRILPNETQKTRETVYCSVVKLAWIQPKHSYMNMSALGCKDRVKQEFSTLCSINYDG